MNTEALFLFLILLLGLALCSFLGGNCGKEGLTGNFSGQFNVNDATTTGSSSGYGNQYDNYNHYSGSSTQLTTGNTFYGQNGTTAVVVTNSDGSQSLQITLPNSSSPVTFSPTNTTSSSSSSSSSSSTSTTDASSSSVENFSQSTQFYGPSGATATIINTNNNQQAIMVQTSSGTYYYNISGTPSSTTSNPSSSNPSSSSSYYPSSNPYSSSYPSQNVGTATGNSNPYSSSLPTGIPFSQIAPGQEDLYILKSEIVPPVCPACPTSGTIPRQKPCPACPACARCPEPSFECKKVPNYSAINNDFLPTPILNDFSQFGM